MQVKVKRRLLRVSLKDLEDGKPEVIPLQVPEGFRVNGSKYIFKTKPFAHQMAALRRTQALGGGALFMEQGTGKTAVAIHFIGLKYLEEGCGKVLVICPMSAMGVWVKEIRKHLPDDLRRGARVVRLYGTRTRRTKKIGRLIANSRGSGLNICIINHESSWRLEEWLVRFAPETVIVDESHRIKSPKAKQSKAAWRLGRKAKYHLILTGTPIVGGAHDVWSQ